MLLSFSGHEVRIAHDGEQALDAMRDFRPDVAFLDIGMPRLSGYEVAEPVRAEPWGREMKLIAVTGWGQPDDKLRARSAGFDQHLRQADRSDGSGSLAGLLTRLSARRPTAAPRRWPP